MREDKKRGMGFIASLMLVFGFITLAVGLIRHNGAMPDFTTTGGILTTALIWVGALALIPALFLKGLSWMARGKNGDHSHVHVADFAKPGPNVTELRTEQAGQTTVTHPGH